MTIRTSAVIINEGNITRNGADRIEVREKASSFITIEGTPLKITFNGDDGIDIEADSRAEINRGNII